MLANSEVTIEVSGEPLGPAGNNALDRHFRRYHAT
jgi:hypothetical protein